MTASPIDLTGDMVAIEQHWLEVQRLQAAGLFTVDEWSQPGDQLHGTDGVGDGWNAACCQAVRDGRHGCGSRISRHHGLTSPVNG